MGGILKPGIATTRVSTCLDGIPLGFIALSLMMVRVSRPPGLSRRLSWYILFLGNPRQ